MGERESTLASAAISPSTHMSPRTNTAAQAHRRLRTWPVGLPPPRTAHALGASASGEVVFGGRRIVPVQNQRREAGRRQQWHDAPRSFVAFSPCRPRPARQMPYRQLVVVNLTARVQSECGVRWRVLFLFPNSKHLWTYHGGRGDTRARPCISAASLQQILSSDSVYVHTYILLYPQER